jgi:uncharacterized Ntn-hydrolase superfamily protein
MHALSRALLWLCLAWPAMAFAAQGNVERPVNTYSIVAYDSLTGEFGAAVQSHWFNVSDVIWLEAGIGAVATQSFVEVSYGPLGLDMMRSGKTASQALAGLVEADPQRSVRQVAMVDRQGNAAVHTGDKCIDYAGHRTGRFYSVQANLMRDSTVWGAMAEAYESTKGDLAERMMAALEAAQREGGDIRGRQSAAMVVVSGTPTGQSWRDRTIDIRVDDSPEPLVELRRLLDLSRAYNYMNRGDELVAEGKLDEAGEVYGQAAKLAPGNLEIIYWHAVALVTAGEVDRALPLFRDIFAQDDAWRVLVPRLVKAGLLPDNGPVIEQIMAQ